MPSNTTKAAFLITPTTRQGLKLHGRQYILFCLLVTYMFIVQLGSLFRFTVAGREIGISTIIAGSILALGVFSIDRRIIQSPLAIATGILVILAILGAAFSPFDIAHRVRAHAELALYWGLAIVVASQFYSTVHIYKIVFGGVIGLLLAASLTLVDYSGLASIPRCNELGYSSVAYERGAATRVQQASGFFPLRSAMAAYYSLSIPSAYFIFLYGYQRRDRLLGIGAFLAGLACVVSTHNRSAVISIVIAISVFLVFRREHVPSRRASRWVRTLLVAFAVLAIAYVFLGDHFRVYLARTSYAFGRSEGSMASDYSRVKFFWFAVEQVMHYPLGRGMTDLQLSSGMRISPHNIVTAVIWGIGLSAFAWVPWFIYLAFREAVAKRGETANILVFSLLAFCLNNMMHESISTGVAWVMFGLFLSPSVGGGTCTGDTPRGYYLR